MKQIQRLKKRLSFPHVVSGNPVSATSWIPAFAGMTALIMLLISTSAFAQAAGPVTSEDEFLLNVLWDTYRNLPKKHEPKIGLALGGGGARGLAHIGVLKVLEE